MTIPVPSLAILVSVVLVLSCRHTNSQTESQTRMIAILNTTTVIIIIIIITPLAMVLLSQSSAAPYIKRIIKTNIMGPKMVKTLLGNECENKKIM